MRSRLDNTRIVRRNGGWHLIRTDGSVAWSSEAVAFGDDAVWPEQPGPDRDALILAAVRGGAARFSFANVTSSTNEHAATFRIFGDALQMPFEASATGFVRVSVSAALEQTIADLLDCSLLTAKLADLLFAQRTTSLPPHTQVPDATMVTTRVMVAQSAWIDAQLAAGSDTTIVQTVGKHWIVDNLFLSKAAGTARDGRPRAINYGWAMTGPSFQGVNWPRSVTLPNVFTVQNRGWAHSSGEADYSQNCVLVSNDCVVDGQAMRLADVLRDPTLSYLANADGVLHVLRQPGVAPVAPVGGGNALAS
jgi:hypothetical protein